MNSHCPVEGSQTPPWPAHSLLGLGPCWCREISKLINPQKITSPIHWSMITVLMKKPIEDTEFSPQWMGACVCGGGGSKRRLEVRGWTVDIIAISGTRQTITSHSTLGVARRCSRMKESPTPTGVDKWLMVKDAKGKQSSTSLWQLWQDIPPYLLFTTA